MQISVRGAMPSAKCNWAGVLFTVVLIQHTQKSSDVDTIGKRGVRLCTTACTNPFTYASMMPQPPWVSIEERVTNLSGVSRQQNQSFRRQRA